MKLNKIIKTFLFYTEVSGSIIPPIKMFNYFLLKTIEKKIKSFKKIRLYLTPKKKFKPYYMKTKFGTFLADSLEKLATLRPYYEMFNQKIMKSNFKEFENEKDKVFINVGTHIGRHFIPVARKKYLSYGFEPTPQIFRAIQINTLLSKVEKNSFLYNFALGNEDKMMDFKYYNHHEGGNSILQKGDYHDSGVVPKIIKVPVKIFDNLKLNIDLKKVRLIIIDVESFEYKTLKGMKKSLSKMTSVDILIEIMKSSPDKKNIIEFMIKLGFKAKQISTHDWYFKKRK